MNVVPELKSLIGSGFDGGAPPGDPEDCEVFFEATIGPAGSPGEEIFSFTVITPRALLRDGKRRWGRGILIVPRFSRDEVEVALQNLLSHCARPTWNEVARCLNRELRWEFDDYSEYRE